MNKYYIKDEKILTVIMDVAVGTVGEPVEYDTVIDSALNPAVGVKHVGGSIVELTLQEKAANAAAQDYTPPAPE